MNYYSGFSLKNDRAFFKEYIKDSVYTVSGFSYGAIKAFKYVKQELERGNRVDTLQLFSPAFFQTKSSKFKKLQTITYTKNEDAYLRNFIKSCFLPHEQKKIEHSENFIEELNELLNYEYIKSDFLELIDKGLVVEVYLGSEDRIIDVESAREFFLDIATVTYIKNANHFLQTD